MAGSPEAMIGAMFAQLAVWSDTPRCAGSGFTRLVVELADLPGHPAARAGVASPERTVREIWLLPEGAICSILVTAIGGTLPPPGAPP